MVVFAPSRRDGWCVFVLLHVQHEESLVIKLFDI